MMWYLGYFVATNEQEMVNNSYNSRQQIITGKNYRGSIYSADGERLAYTEIDENGEEHRIYPYENLFSHAVGFSTKGRTGIEAIANYYLINTNIPLSDQIDNELSGDKNPGDSVYTTLRKDLQEIASKALGVSKGAVIVSNVKTGELLAMVSKPDFNPMTVVQDWETYLAQDSDSVLLNRATQGIYPPGSTFKIITSLAYIRENPDTYGGYRYQCSGAYHLEEDRVNCYHGSVHNVVDLTKSFAKSCNASFVNIGMSLDRKKFADLLKELDFGEKLPLSYPYSVGDFPISEETTDSEMIQISIGQGIAQITPIHLHMITNGIPNGGTVMAPYVLDRVVTRNGNTIKQFQPKSYQSIMTEEESETVRSLMTAVVEEGTARKLSGLSYTAAGKTGSAEYNGVKEDSHAWFTGFAPAEDPEVSVTIIVEGIGSGGDYAVPIAKRLFDAYFGAE